MGISSRFVGAGLGAVAGGILLGMVGSASGNEIPGALAGTVLGSMMGYGNQAGFVSTITVYSMVWAIAFILLARGFDDYCGVMGIPGAVFGAVFGWFWRRPAEKTPKKRCNDLNEMLS